MIIQKLHFGKLRKNRTVSQQSDSAATGIANEIERPEGPTPFKARTPIIPDRRSSRVWSKVTPLDPESVDEEAIEFTGKSFLSFPDKVRSQVYNLTLIATHEVVICGCNEDHCRMLTQPALTRVSHQIRRETLPIYYRENNFMVRGIYDGVFQAPLWLLVMPQLTLDMIHRVSISSMNVRNTLDVMETLGFRLYERMDCSDLYKISYLPGDGPIWLTFTSVTVAEKAEEKAAQQAVLRAIEEDNEEATEQPTDQVPEQADEQANEEVNEEMTEQATNIAEYSNPNEESDLGETSSVNSVSTSILDERRNLQSDFDNGDDTISSGEYATIGIVLKPGYLLRVRNVNGSPTEEAFGSVERPAQASEEQDENVLAPALVE